MRVVHSFDKLAATALMYIAAIAPVSAHHSISTFDARQTVKITGVVREFHWLNPHVVVDVEDSDHKHWSLEMSSPNTMLDEGWARDTLAVGDRITVIANPMRKAMPAVAGGNRLLYVGILLPSGKTLGRTDPNDKNQTAPRR